MYIIAKDPDSCKFVAFSLMYIEHEHSMILFLRFKCWDFYVTGRATIHDSIYDVVENAFILPVACIEAADTTQCSVSENIP